MNSIQIALFGVVGTLLALQFKSGKSEYGIYVSLAVSLFLFLCMLSRLEIFVRTVKKIADYIKLDAGQMSILLKMAGMWLNLHPESVKMQGIRILLYRLRFLQS